MCRIDSNEFIRLQRDALRAAELLEERRTLTETARAAAAQLRAHELLKQMPLVSDAEAELRTRLVGDLPFTAEGCLHEAAFVALAEAAVWEHRELTLWGRRDCGAESMGDR